jgi:PPP family 3-phenylpropionic acid transporter
VIWLNALLLAAAALYTPTVPPLAAGPASPAKAQARLGELVRLPAFRRVVAVAALILGSHAMHDGFAVIRWQEAGIGSDMTGILWSESVAAEVLVFLLLGRPVLDRLGPPGVALLAASAGVVRWAVSAETASVPAIALIQPLHGITFALLHLACMRRLAETVPARLSATAMAVYGILGIGLATALLTLVSGWLYGAVGPRGFWLMAALCIAAMPLARKL